jgi:hypothetical protein
VDSGAAKATSVPVSSAPPASQTVGTRQGNNFRTVQRNSRSVTLRNGRRIESYEETYFNKTSFVIRGIGVNGKAGCIAFPPELISWLEDGIALARASGTIPPRPTVDGGVVVFRRPPQCGKVSP